VRLHPVLETILVAGAAAVLGLGLAVGQPLNGLGPAGPAIAAAVAIAALFAWRPVEGLVAFATVVLLADTVEYWTGADLRYVDEVSLLLIGAVAVAVHRRALSVPPAGWREVALAGLFLAGLVSSLVNGVPASIWIPGLALLAKGFAFFYLVTSLPIDMDGVRRIVGSLLVVGLVIVAIGLVEFLAPQLAGSLGVPTFRQQRGSLEVVTSLFTHPALYGWLAAVLSLVLVARFVERRDWWALPLAVLVGGASLLSGRRTPLIGLFAGLAVGALRRAAWRRGAARVWGAVALGILVIVLVSLPALGSFYQGTLKDYFGSSEAIGEVFAEDPDSRIIRPLQARVALYAGSLAVARDEFPLGAGIGRFGSHMSRDQYSPVYAAYGLDRVHGLRERQPTAVTDTFWPMILGESGILGLIAVAAFFALLGRDLWRAAAPVGSVGERAFALGALLVYTEALVRSAGSSVFVAPPVAYWVFGAAALSLALRRHGAAATSTGT
jgi:hypothetical protein